MADRLLARELFEELRERLVSIGATVVGGVVVVVRARG